MIIDMTRTKIERSILEALFVQQCGEISHALKELARVQPVTEELITQGYANDKIVDGRFEKTVFRCLCPSAGAMKSKMKVTKTQRKWWVLSMAGYYESRDHHLPSRSEILAVCKTKKEAERLRDQNEKFTGASIDRAPEYMHQY